MPPRVRVALLLSLLAHALLLRIFLGGQSFGLPGLDALWKERRADAADVRIQLALPEPALPVAPSVAPAPTPVLVDSPSPSPTVQRAPDGMAQPAAVPPAPAAVITARTPSDVILPVAPEQAALPQPDPALMQKQADDARLAIEQAAAREAAQRAAREEQQRLAILQAAHAATQQARAETERKETERKEAAAQAEAARVELAREESAQRAVQRAAQEAERADAARREQARLAQLEAAHQDAIRQERAQRDAAQRETARQAQLQQEQLTEAQQARLDQEAKREERLRAIGAQMKQEAAQRDAPSRSLLPSASSLRRGLLLGRADANTELVKYAEAMARKIEFNQTFDIVRDALRQPHTQALVTVAIRADGSVEKVTFVVSSGAPALDEAIRQVIASQAPYAAFTPALARQYDVVEIRRTWLFDTAIRLQ